ncbi:HAMP domain-containing sensor histidine kinase [Nocardioides marinus]|uniref:histidine kinase n=1 Tax=Nocardioides marinus TaxID=374514 RepID=A0A7Z0C0F1_9ACTN|nr:signal transduction histidine kinase [Nocardioides marinus]
MTTHLAFGDAPRREQVYLVLAGVAAVAAPLALTGPWGADRLVSAHPPDWFTCAVLVALSALNVEIGRVLVGGLARGQQPHKALSAWAFACAMVLPAAWLLVVVPLTYAHTRWRGLRAPLWKWVGSAAFLVLAGTAASLVPRLVLGGLPNWMQGDGRGGLGTLLVAAAVFLVVESALFAGSAWLNHAEDEQWLRSQLTSPGYHLNEAGVVLTGGLMAAIWTAGAWFVLLLGPLYALMQRAVLLEPLRENAAMAAELVETNRQLEAVSEFKSDLMGMLAHEVGNPLAAVTGYAEVAVDSLEEGDPDGALPAVRVVQRNADQIGGVLHDIVALVEANPGGLTARPEPTLLGPHLQAAAAAQPAGAQPEVHCADDLVALIQPGHLDQVLANLLGNATKYAGGATRLVATPDGERRVVVAVQDDGPGIPDDFRDQVFRRRTRHPDTADTVSGRGLGLHISRALALANGGDLRLSSEPGGSCFELVLQAGPPPA